MATETETQSSTISDGLGGNRNPSAPTKGVVNGENGPILTPSSSPFKGSTRNIRSNKQCSLQPATSSLSVPKGRIQEKIGKKRSTVLNSSCGGANSTTSMAKSSLSPSPSLASKSTTAQVYKRHDDTSNPTTTRTIPGRGTVVVTPDSGPSPVQKKASPPSSGGKRKRGKLPLHRKSETTRSNHSLQAAREGPDKLQDGPQKRARATKGSIKATTPQKTIKPTPSLQTVHTNGRKTQFEQDAIAGLFMMTKSPPVDREISAAQAATPQETPSEAIAGLLMMNKATPPTQHHDYLPYANAAASMKSYVAAAASFTNNNNIHAAPVPSSYMSKPWKKKQVQYRIDNPTSMEVMATPTPFGLESGYADGVPCFLPPYLPSASQHAKPIASLPTIKIVQRPPVEVLMDNLPNGKNPWKPSKFTTAEESAWERRFQQAVHFKQQHGHCRIPYQYPPNSDLARWAKRQKYQYKLFIGERESREKSSSLTPERIAMLESLGFVWDSQEVGWLEQYDALIAYIRKNGHAKVAKRERSLGRWVCSQRTRLSQGKMTLERFMKLEAVGFVWYSSSTCSEGVAKQVEEMQNKMKREMEADPYLWKRYAEWKAQVENPS